MDAPQKQLDRLSPVDAEKLAEFCLSYAFAPEPRRILTIGRSHFMKHRAGRAVLGAVVIVSAALGAYALQIPPGAAALMLLFGVLIGIGIVWWKP